MTGRAWDALMLFPARRPAAAIALIAAVTLFFAAFLPRLRIDSSMETIFIESDPEREVYEEFKRTFGEDEIIVIGLKAPQGDVWNGATLRKIRRISDAIADLPAEYGVDRVFSLTRVDDVRGTEGTFTVAPLMKEIPEDASAIAAIRAQAYENPLYVRNLVSEDGRAAAINVWLEYRPGDREYKERLFNRIREVVAKEKGPEEFHFAGIPVLTVYTGEYLRRDMAIFIPCTIAIMALALWFTFRSLSGVILPLLTVLISVVWTVGFIAAAGKSISIVSSIVPSLLIAIGTAYGIQVIAHYYEEQGPAKERAENCLRHVFVPVLLSGVTTVCGFLSLLANDVTQLREFGLYAAVGTFAAMVSAVAFVPAMLHYIHPSASDKAPDEAAHGWLLTFLMGIYAFDKRHPRLIFAGCVVSLVVGVAGIFRIRIDTDYAANFRPDSEPVRALLFMRENLSGERPINVVIRAKGGEAAALDPKVLLEIEDLERHLKQHPLVAATLSISGYLKNMNKAMHADDEAFRRVPERADLAAQYVELYGRPGELRRYLSHDRAAAAVVGRSSIISSIEFLSVMEQLKDYAAKRFEGLDVTITGSMYLLSKASISISWGQATSLALAVGQIGAIMFLLFRSFKFGVIALIPNALPVLLVFGCMGWLGVTLNIGTSIMASMCIGIAVDDTIHSLVRYRKVRAYLGSAEAAVEHCLRTTGRAVVMTSVTLAIGFLVLCLSSFAPLVALGWLTAVTMMVCLAAELLILPALLVTWDA